MFFETMRDMLRAMKAAMRFAALARLEGGFANEASARAPVTSARMRRLHARAGDLTEAPSQREAAITARIWAA